MLVERPVTFLVRGVTELRELDSLRPFVRKEAKREVSSKVTNEVTSEAKREGFRRKTEPSQIKFAKIKIKIKIGQAVARR